MSTATIAAGNVRPLEAIKADAANFLANKPESILADVKGAISWLPRKAKAVVLRTARFLRVPEMARFVSTNFSRFIGLVGKGAFATEVLTSHWGQTTIRKGLEYSSTVLRFGIKWTWRISTSPLRLFGPTRSVLEKIETGVAKANAKLTPNSGETFGPLQVVRDIIAYYISASRTHMKLARITALAVMSVRVTRRFVPVGWIRVLTYLLDGIFIARAYGDVLDHTWVGRKLAVQTAVIESDVRRQAETVGAEASRLTREAAADTAAKMRSEADQMESAGLDAAGEVSESMVAETAAKAQEMRDEAAALEQTAERLNAEESTKEKNAATATAVETKPGPAVPPMGGRTPSSGPQAKPHQRHGSQGARR